MLHLFTYTFRMGATGFPKSMSHSKVCCCIGREIIKQHIIISLKTYFIQLHQENWQKLAVETFDSLFLPSVLILKLVLSIIVLTQYFSVFSILKPTQLLIVSHYHYLFSHFISGIMS